ncbi:MAG: T9SS type A sorting domain-containing protein [Lachnospiraceae bacterium]|nr:T9SS type A sorting domain-containing protein [Lachnospiraceae bacterium]
MVDRAGGLDMIYDYHDLSWWVFVAEQYEVDWHEIAKTYENYGTVDDTAEKLTGGRLIWDTEYVVYAYYLDEEYVPCSEVYSASFKTEAPNTSDIDFNVELVNVVPDEANGEGKVKVTLRVTPTNDDFYGNHLHESKFWDFYDGNEQYTFKDYLDNQVYPFITSVRSGVQELTYSRCKEDSEYVFVSLGYDETPTTGERVHMFRFKSEVSGLDTVNVAPNAIVAVKGGVLIDSDYDALAVYAADGSTVGVYRNANSIELPAGMYILNLKGTDGKTLTQKIIVR